MLLLLLLMWWWLLLLLIYSHGIHKEIGYVYIGFIYEFYSYQQTYKFLTSPLPLVLHTECTLYILNILLSFYTTSLIFFLLLLFTMATLFILFLFFSCYSCVSDLFFLIFAPFMFSQFIHQTNTLNINSLYIFRTINMGKYLFIFPSFSTTDFLGLVFILFFPSSSYFFYPKLFFFFFFIIIHVFLELFFFISYPVSLFFLYVGYVCSIYIMTIWDYIYFVGYNIFHSM